VKCSPVSVCLRIIHHNISVGLTNTNNGQQCGSTTGSVTDGKGARCIQVRKGRVDNGGGWRQAARQPLTGVVMEEVAMANGGG
jgi:hypothetical protein